MDVGGVLCIVVVVVRNWNDDGVDVLGEPLKACTTGHLL